MKKIVKWLLKVIQRGDFLSLLPFLPHLMQKHRRSFMRELYTEFDHFHFTDTPQKNMIQGLHQLLASDGRIRFSILVEGEKDLKRALDSAFQQTAPHVEVIFQGDPSLDILKKYPLLKTNVEPSGTHVFLLKSSEWMRPDLLFRYEQILRSVSEKLILHTAAARLNPKGKLTPGSLFALPRKTFFPYEFTPFNLEGLLIPIEFYSRGVTLLDLDVKGAKFFGIPLPLLAKGNEEPTGKDYIQAFRAYTQAKNLPWKMEQGPFENTVRAIPSLSKKPRIQAVIPYKDHKKLTLAAVDSLQKSKGVELYITAVDNGSSDRGIQDELEQWGIEVIRLDEPFNYSRLNNYAVKNTRHPQELIFFMNNDAEMDEEALLEMSRWIDQPKIGMVGARLHFPDGSLQHGGVVQDPSSAIPGAINYHHREIHLPLHRTRLAQLVHIPDAVTAAAALIRRDLFCSLGGFDEILYPIAYSDTNLAYRLSQKGLYCLYTPYATGIHHESTTREPGLFEDFDRSRFLYELNITELCGTLLGKKGWI